MVERNRSPTQLLESNTPRGAVAELLRDWHGFRRYKVWRHEHRHPACAGIGSPTMHSSYALSSSDFTVERGDKQQPLTDLWPGGYVPGDRLGVVVSQPMDPVGCSNLICATITL